jgi:hypothetical protein
MLTITVGGNESYDEETQRISIVGGTLLQLEHSLVSLSKWEAIHEKPFLDDAAKTPEEVLSYVECMLVGDFPRGEILQQLSQENLEEINAYIDAKMSATWFSDVVPETRSSEKITSELIYYWLTVFNIPFACENWHLNRLFTLIRIANVKQAKPKKMSKAEVAQRNRELNARRKAQLGTKG